MRFLPEIEFYFQVDFGLLVWRAPMTLGVGFLYVIYSYLKVAFSVIHLRYGSIVFSPLVTWPDYRCIVCACAGASGERATSDDDDDARTDPVRPRCANPDQGQVPRL